jgi:hypothetical protein
LTSPQPLSCEARGAETLILSCSSISFQEREAGRERFIEFTSSKPEIIEINP